MKTSKDYMREMRARNRAKGLIPVSLWIRPEHKDKAKKAERRWQKEAK